MIIHDQGAVNSLLMAVNHAADAARFHAGGNLDHAVMMAKAAMLRIEEALREMTRK